VCPSSQIRTLFMTWKSAIFPAAHTYIADIREYPPPGKRFRFMLMVFDFAKRVNKF